MALYNKIQLHTNAKIQWIKAKLDSSTYSEAFKIQKLLIWQCSKQSLLIVDNYIRLLFTFVWSGKISIKLINTRIHFINHYSFYFYTFLNLFSCPRVGQACMHFQMIESTHHTFSITFEQALNYSKHKPFWLPKK